MVEAVMFWNEPTTCHWGFEIGPGWTTFGRLVTAASQAVAAEQPRMTRVLGGISPIDPDFIRPET